MNPILSELPTWLQVAIAAAPLGVLLVGLGGGIVASFGTVVATVGAYVAYRSYRQRQYADNRAEWWRRVQFAISASASERELEARIGDELLTLFALDETAAKEEQRLLLSVLRALRGESPQGGDEPAGQPDE